MKGLLVLFLTRRVSALDDAAILVLRLGVGLGMLSHGMPKLLGYGDKAQSFPDPLGVGSPVSLALTVFAEVLCSLGLAVGFLTRLTLIPLIVTMVVAMLIIHGGDPWAKKEAAFLYLIPYVVLMMTGPGRFSLDTLLFGRRR